LGSNLDSGSFAGFMGFGLGFNGAGGTKGKKGKRNRRKGLFLHATHSLTISPVSLVHQKN